jgi:hypothetical protein
VFKSFILQKTACKSELCDCCKFKNIRKKSKLILEQRTKILEENCEKDESGKPLRDEIIEKTKDGKVIEKSEKDKQYKYRYKTESEEIAAIKKYVDLLNLEEDIKVRTVKYEDIEQCDSENYDSLNGKEIECMLFMIEE